MGEGDMNLTCPEGRERERGMKRKNEQRVRELTSFQWRSQSRNVKTNGDRNERKGESESWWRRGWLMNVWKELQMCCSLKDVKEGGKQGQRTTERGRARTRRRHDSTLYNGWNNIQYFHSLLLLHVSSFIVTVASFFHTRGGGRGRRRRRI